MELFFYISQSLIIIGIAFSIYYQHDKISSLKTAVDSQKNILDSAKIFMNIFDLNKVKEYVDLNMKKANLEADLKIKDITKNFDEVIRPINLQTENYIQRMTGLYSIILSLLIFIPLEKRKEIINTSGADEQSKVMVLSSLEKLGNIYKPILPEIENSYLSALSNLLLGENKKKIKMENGSIN